MTYEKSGITWSTPGISSSGNFRPQSTSTRSPSYSKTTAFLPNSPSPPRGSSVSGGCEGTEEEGMSCDLIEQVQSVERRFANLGEFFHFADLGMNIRVAIVLQVR